MGLRERQRANNRWWWRIEGTARGKMELEKEGDLLDRGG